MPGLAKKVLIKDTKIFLNFFLKSFFFQLKLFDRKSLSSRVGNLRVWFDFIAPIYNVRVDN